MGPATLSLYRTGVKDGRKVYKPDTEDWQRPFAYEGALVSAWIIPPRRPGIEYVYAVTRGAVAATGDWPSRLSVGGGDTCDDDACELVVSNPNILRLKTIQKIR